MSKIKCEYCDTIFDYHGQANCPGCGVSLGDNRQVEELTRAEAEKEAQEASLRARDAEKARKMVQDSFEQQHRMSRFITAFAIFVFVIILIGFAITFLSGLSFFSGFGGVFS